ncbi:MAG TPA: hypothetical protein PLL33_06745, partial [Paracoccus sp. (in: a-proteobacteria)]|nr:hypothetical protein [Paracoccus sp. (in: a-proteobacteria)]
MAGFRHLGVLSQPGAVFVSNVTDLTLGLVGGRLMLYSATHTGGGVGVWQLDAADALATSVGAHAYSGRLQHMADPQVVLIERPGGLS